MAGFIGLSVWFAYTGQTALAAGAILVGGLSIVARLSLIHGRNLKTKPDAHPSVNPSLSIGTTPEHVHKKQPTIKTMMIGALSLP